MTEADAFIEDKKGYLMMNTGIMNYVTFFGSQQISSQLNTYGRFYSVVLAAIIITTPNEKVAFVRMLFISLWWITS